MLRSPVALVAVFALGAAPAAETRLTVAWPSTLRLNGSSNIARWRCSGSTMNGVMEVSAPLEKINEVIDHIEDGQIGRWMSDPAAGRFPQPRFEMAIPIDTLRCSGGRPMERDLRGALKSERFPDIQFRFKQLSGAIEHDIDRHLYHAVIDGQISLAGTSREIEMRVD